MPDDKQNPVEQYQPADSSQSGFDPAAQQTFIPHQQQVAEEPAEQFSSVAAGVTGNKKMFIIVFGAVAAGILLYTFLPSGVDPVQQQRVEQKQQLEKRATEIVKESKPLAAPIETAAVTIAPTITQPPPVAAPQPPEPPPAPAPVAPAAPSFPTDPSSNAVPSFVPEASNTPSKGVFSSDEEERKRQAAITARRKSSIMVTGSGKGGLDSLTGEGAAKKDGAADASTPAADGKDAKKKTTDGYLGFGEGGLNEQALAKTASTQIKATYIGKLDSMIAQGKIIDAVLETAINTDLAGTLRGIVTRDVYAESGKAVLIPKGSRLIGQYTTEIKPGQSRVNVVWDRLIRPDGVDLALKSSGTDPLGRAGVQGFVDDKLMTKLATAFLISYIVPTVTSKIANVKDNAVTQTSTTNTDGTTTSSSTGTTGSEQLKESSDKFKELTQKSIEEAFSTTTTIYVDQGTRINVFVNQDIVFPAQVTSKATGVLK